MANTNIEIPDFDFSAFFFPQILESLIQFKRQNVPELTDESEFEPFIQLLRAFALVGHLNNTLVDLVANESTLPTARLVESVRNMLRLIDFELNPATPSQVELLYELSRTFASSVTLVPASAQAATQRSGDDPIITVEVDEALIITRTDQIGAAASEEDVAVTDRTAALISTLPGDDFAPWITPNVGDVVYFGHPEIMFDKLTLDITSGWSAAALGVWEFFEGDFLQIAPDQVQQIGPILRVSLNNLLGTFTREGTFIRVTLNETGAFEEVVSQFSGGLNFVDIGFLGQTAPSANVEDYSVGSDWTAIDDVTDGTNGLDQSGDVEYSIPQSVEKNWKKETVGGVEAFWIRFRLVTIGFGSPVLRNALIDDGNQFAIRLATQGISAADDPLGSSTGLPDQRFETSRDNFIRKSETVTVDGETWASVKDFLNSAPTDEHYVIELGENDRATVVFGSGNQGKIPPIGAGNISISYRFGAQDEGNVGPNTIVVDKQGLTFINSITNPRQASGHQQADGADEASLERVKISGPASLRTKTVALGPTDVEELTRAFATVQGSRLQNSSKRWTSFSTETSFHCL